MTTFTKFNKSTNPVSRKASTPTGRLKYVRANASNTKYRFQVPFNGGVHTSSFKFNSPLSAYHAAILFKKELEAIKDKEEYQSRVEGLSESILGLPSFKIDSEIHCSTFSAYFFIAFHRQGVLKIDSDTDEVTMFHERVEDDTILNDALIKALLSRI